MLMDSSAVLAQSIHVIPRYITTDPPPPSHRTILNSRASNRDYLPRHHL